MLCITQGFIYPVLKETLRTSLQTAYSENDLKKWFDPLVLHESRRGSFEVRFPHALFASWFNDEKREILEKELANATGQVVSVTYRTPGGTAASKKLLPARQCTNFFAPFVCEDGGNYCFETFLCNKKNEFPLAMAKEVAKAPASQTYFPFVICGKGTCGKTHLLRATAKNMAEYRNNSLIYLGSVDDLAAAYSDIGNKNTTRQQLLRCDSFFLDDAQRLAAHPALQQELIYVSDHFRDHKKPLVLAFDEGLSKSDISEKLRSRLEAGLVVTLKKPDLDVRLRYTLGEAQNLALPLSKEHALTIAQRFHDLRYLSGIITKISAFCSKNTRPLSNMDLDKLLEHGTENSKILLTPESIISTVAEQFSLPVSDILGNKRQHTLVQARQISMLLCRELLGLSFPSLGVVFGGKNHATIFYACKKIQKLQESDNIINNLVSTIRKKCQSRRM